MAEKDVLEFDDDFFTSDEKQKAASVAPMSPVETPKPPPEVVVTQNTVPSTIVPVITPQSGEINLDFDRTNIAPTLIGDGVSQQFETLVNRVKEQYPLLPSLVYSEVYTELSELTVPACPTPTLQVINQELQKSQAAKDRVTELYIQVTQCWILKDRLVDILREAGQKFSEEKSADKRKGENSYRLANFEIDLAKTEALEKACKYVMMNLVSLQDTLSRRITNVQLQIKLMDIGRTVLPDFDFSKKNMDIQIDTPSVEPVEKDENGNVLAKELDF